MIFLGGIHGVGKTSLLASIKQLNNIPIFSASELIARQRNLEYIKNKNRTDIAGDQDILILAIKEFVNVNDYILDGHFCLLNADSEVNRIPKDIFFKLPIEKIFVLVADISEIIQRISKRDGNKYQHGTIKLFQDSEIIYAKEIANEKNITFKIIDNEKPLLEYLKENKI